ncbi:MAG TPA: YihY/virulence factor BrkB family protein [Steroidobacteraceae bacterium]|jgi:membrane protein|nr:YihY/virulence factor BrkB family protein [Steroidobacteraceae bacterium]
MWMRIWAFLDWCFFGPVSERPGAPGALLRLLRYPYAVVRDLARGEINLRAMGLVYTTLLSLIPLLAFSFAILKSFGGHRDLEPIVYEFFRPVGGAAATELTARVVQFANHVSSGVVGSVGLALLAWTLLGTIKKVEDSFNFLWHVEQPRSFARRVAEYSTLLIAGPVLLVGFIGLSHAALNSAPVQEVVHLPLLQRLRGSSIILAPYVMVTAFFTALYMMVPNTRVQWRAALTGAVAAGILWAAIGKMFTAFVVYSARLTIVYAGFAFVVTALVWTYFGWLILLAGAQLSFYVQNPVYLRLGLQQLRLSGEELEQLALKLMYFVGRTHVAGGRRWSVNRLADELGLPGVAVAQMAATLERAGLLIVTDDDELLPARDISRIGVYEILQIARSQRSGHVAPRNLPVPPVDRVVAALDEARRKGCGELTLRELAEEAPRPALQFTPRQSSSR